MYVYVRIYQLHWSPKILNLSQPWLSQSHFSGLGMGKLAANPVFHPLSSRCLRDGDWGGSGSAEGNHFSPNWTVAIGYSHLCFLFSEKKNYRSELKHLPRYPLVNCHKKRTGKIQHFSWKNPLWLDWAVSSWGFQTNGSKSFSLWLGVGTPSDCSDCFSGWKPTTGGYWRLMDANWYRYSKIMTYDSCFYLGSFDLKMPNHHHWSRVKFEADQGELSIGSFHPSRLLSGWDGSGAEGRPNRDRTKKNCETIDFLQCGAPQL